MTLNWTERIAAFSLSPSRFLSGTTAEAFLAELLRELRDDRASYSLKVLLLAPLCEHPTLLCLSDSVGEETALELMSVMAQCPPKSLQFRCQLLVAITCVLVCSSCAGARSQASLDFLSLLLETAGDPGELPGDGGQQRLRAGACACLRELEACCPGLLSPRLELLDGLRQRETSRLHQALAGVQSLALRNAVHQLGRETGAGAEELKALLGGNASDSWEEERGPATLTALTPGPTGSLPTLHTGPDCKELRSVLASLLEDSYLLTPPCQAALLLTLTEVVAMVPAVPPAIFRAQLLRLLGTSQVCLLHSTLLLKASFTDSLFGGEDEDFLLRRLLVLSQHPLLSPPDQLFYMDCILHFPENRPLSGGEGEEAPPVALTPRLAAALLPTLLNDGHTLLARVKLLALLYLEEGEGGGPEGGPEGGQEGGGGPAHLYQLLASLLDVAEAGGGGRETVVTSFRAAFLFLLYFGHVRRFSGRLTARLCRLYMRRPQLAPHLINLADRVQERTPAPDWTPELLRAVQRAVTEAPLARLTLADFSRHLQVLARVAEEGGVCQQPTLAFLARVVTPSSSSLCGGGGWRLGAAVLAVCRRLLVHPDLDSLLAPLSHTLRHLAGHYGDTDVQDHARLYHALLTTVSRQKLAGVLAAGAAEDRRQLKQRSLSCLVAESEELTSALTVHRLEESVCRLTEAGAEPGEAGADQGEAGADQGEAGADQGGGGEAAGARQASPSEAEAALDAYRAQFREPDFSSHITLRYTLTHTEAPPPGFDRLYSIRLHFGLTDQHYEALGDVSVPRLFRGRPPPAVRLRLRPRRPGATTLLASALFTAQDGRTWHAALPPLPVAFQQSFLPLPAPGGWGPARRLALFRGLWGDMSAPGGGGALSLFCCPLTGAALSALVDKHLARFLVSDPSHADESKAAIFLPPKSHVLLRIRPERDASHFDIATDNWELLPPLNSYLLTITSSQEGGGS
ncbi:unnamed protein product [Menidia menidia]|uniref:AP-5 complex subunit beta-1 n=1 Tax=Menidia menidia TaxID=238744 RepID=A0A8S4BLM5_9TELE|nr:unnamed protein product [Menidia menidia]